MIFSKEEILNIFNNFAIDATFTLIIVSFILLIMYVFFKRKILFKTSISFLLLSAVILSSFIYFNEIDLFLLNQKNQYIYNKIAEDIKNKEENQKYQAFREFIDEMVKNRNLTKEDIIGISSIDKSKDFKTNLEIEVQSKKDLEMILNAMTKNQ